MDILIWTWWLRALCTEVLKTLLHMFVMGLICHCPPQLWGPWAVSNLAGKAHLWVKRVHQPSDIILLGHPLVRLGKVQEKEPFKKVFLWKTSKYTGGFCPPRLKARFALLLLVKPLSNSLRATRG